MSVHIMLPDPLCVTCLYFLRYLDLLFGPDVYSSTVLSCSGSLLFFFLSFFLVLSLTGVDPGGCVCVCVHSPLC